MGISSKFLSDILNFSNKITIKNKSKILLIDLKTA